MKHRVLMLTACIALAACSTERRPDIPVKELFPPVGLAATAVWLEDREGDTPRVRSAREIPTSEIRSVVSGGAAAPTSGTRPVPVSTAPRTVSANVTNDEVLNSVVASFRAGCLNNAPEFNTKSAQAAFRSNPPTLRPGMFYLSTGRPGQSCNVAITGYGTDAPGLTRSDVTVLAQDLQQRLGGDIVLSNRNPDQATVRLRIGRTTYRVSSAVSRKGRFSLSVSK